MPVVRHAPRDNPFAAGARPQSRVAAPDTQACDSPPPARPIRLPARRPTPCSPYHPVMSFRLYLSFLAASAVLIYAPGPVNLLTMNQALRAGWRRALPCVWGGTLAVLLQLALTALCLNSLVHLNEHALTVLRWAGAAYLVWLGCKQWLSRAPVAASAAPAASAAS
ncbi:LysE family translocator, partial [Burkholderia sp. Nafp2/4-1b]|uniref:LysE family translocator n=1 Tax=Burkholderia sp. Nafp2/4-1b TaxID=2116686 RepID=UPI001F099923